MGLDSLVYYKNGTPVSLVTPTVIPADQMAGQSDSTVGGDPQCDANDPINACSGVFYLTTTDISVDAVGPELAFKRNYTSLLADTTKYAQTPLGPGWRHRFAERLTLSGQLGSEPITVIYEAATGNRYRFTDQGNGVYKGAIGVWATLARANNIYTLTTTDQTKLLFDSSGRLTERQDAQGRKQQYTYNPTSSLPGSNQLARVTDAVSQRWLAFSYIATPNGVRLATVTNPAQSITFTYNPAGNIQTMTDVGGGVVSYSYTNHRLETISNPANPSGPPALRNQYTNGQVTTQTEASGIVTTYAYTTAANGDKTTTMTIASPGQPTAVIKQHYRPDGTLRYQERNGLFGGYTTFGANLAPLALVDGNGRITGVVSNAAGKPTNIYPADGTEGTITYDAKNNPTNILGLDKVTSVVTYDAFGSVSSITQQGGIGADSVSLSRQYGYSTLPAHSLTSMREADGIGTTYEYNTLGQLTRSLRGAKQKIVTTYTYDSLGRQTEVTVGAGTSLARTTHTKYNGAGLIVAVTENYHYTGIEVEGPWGYTDRNLKTSYGYNTNGQQIWTQTPDGRYHEVTSYDAAGRVRWVVENPERSVRGGAEPYIPDVSATAAPPNYAPENHDANVSRIYGYDARGLTTLITQTGILTGTFAGDPLHRWFSDSTTRVTRIQYDALSRPVTTTLNYRPSEGAGVDRNIELYTYYDGADNVTWRSDALGRWTKTLYDQRNRPIRTIENYEDGIPTSVQAINRPWTDGTDSDIITVTNYNYEGRIDTITENFVNGSWTLTEPITDRVTLFTYDGVGRLTSTRVNAVASAPADHPELNQITQIAYDPTRDRVAGRRDALGRWTSIQYDLFNRVVSSFTNCTTSAGIPVASGCAAFTTVESDRNLPNTTTRYDELGQVYETVNALGIVTRQTLDPVGRPIVTTQNYVAGAPATASTNVRTFTGYNAVGQVISTTNALNQTTRMWYDGLGNLMISTDPTNVETHYGFDGSGTERWAMTPTSDRERFSVTLVDGLGQPVRQIKNYVDGAFNAAQDGTTDDLITTTRYNRAGQVVALVEPGGRETRYQYDGLDRLIAVQENVQTTCATEATDCNLLTQYRYDRAGNRLMVIDARGNRQRQTTYNAASWPTSQTAFTAPRTWTYNALGQVVSESDGSNSLSYTYTSRGAVKRATSLYQATQTHVYDVVGRELAFGDWYGSGFPSSPISVTKTYDPLGRVTLAQQRVFGMATSVGYEYDGTGSRTGLIYPSGRKVTMSYTPRGELATVKEGNATLASYSYDPDGWLRNANFGTTTGVQATRVPDRAGRLSQLTYTRGSLPLGQVSYTLNRHAEQIGKVTTMSGEPTAETFGYDGVGRLIQSTREDYIGTMTGMAYAYDRNGNRISETVGDDFPTLREYNEQNQITTPGWEYDQAGRLTSDPTQTYEYDGWGRLATLTKGSTTTDYRYAADGTLVWDDERYPQTPPTDGPRVAGHRYTVDWAGPQSEILTSNNHTICPETLPCMDSGPDVTQYTYGAERLFETSPANYRSWYLQDGLGSTIGTTDNAGWLQGQQTFSPWGVSQTPPLSAFGFTGELTDATSGLVYLRARWYNPSSGTFLSPDAFVGFPQQPYSLHPYQYGYSNPLTNTDPSGRCIPAGVWFIGQEGCELAGPNPANWSWKHAGDYSLGVLDFAYEMADGLRSAVAPTPYEQHQQLAAIGALFLHPENIPGAVVDHFTDPFEEAYRGWQCWDFRKLGHGAAGSGASIVELAGMAQFGKSFLKGIGKKIRPGGRAGGSNKGAPPKEKGSGKGAGTTCSFSAETLVATSAGAQPIAALEPGDTVLAYNEADQTTGSSTVTALLVSTDTVLVDLQIDAEPINTTPEHPFFTHERGWVAAADLALGDRIRAADGTWGVVERLLLRGDTQVMYNLTVATAHTFFVGEGRWLVHNECGPRVRNVHHEEIGTLEGGIKGGKAFDTGRGIKEVERLVRDYGGRIKDWKKMKGEGYVRLDTGEVRLAELHWYERPGRRVEIRKKGDWID